MSFVTVGVSPGGEIAVVEYYNRSLDAFFITGRVGEQATLDANSSFVRTGMSFLATPPALATSGQLKVCRFYISQVSPYVSSHFYGTQALQKRDYDCEWLRAQNYSAFSWEDYDFAVSQSIGGSAACASGTTPVFRGFRALNGNGKTSNHRYTVSNSSYTKAQAAGYVGEGVQFCASGATDATLSIP